MTDTLKLVDIVPDPEQPRKFFDAAKMAQLIGSIRKEGIISPLVVQDMGAGKYLLIDGERRYRAAKELGLEEVPVTIGKPTTAVERLVRQFNVQEQHEEWTPIEKAEAIIRLAKELKLSMQETCKVLGVSNRDTARYIAVAGLSDKQAWMEGEMSMESIHQFSTLKSSVERLHINVLEKDFTKQEQKKLEHRYIVSIKRGEINSRTDVARLKDSFEKNPAMLEKYLKDLTATPVSLFLESKAKGASALRNMIYNARYITNHGARFLEQPDIKIAEAQQKVLKEAYARLGEVIALFE